MYKEAKPLLGFPVDCCKCNHCEVKSLQSVGNELSCLALLSKCLRSSVPWLGEKQNSTQKSGGNKPRNAPRLEQSTKLGVRSSEGNLDLDLNIRISDLQSNANPKTDFNAEISLLGFPFFPFFLGGNPKKDLKKFLRTAVLYAHA